MEVDNLQSDIIDEGIVETSKEGASIKLLVPFEMQDIHNKPSTSKECYANFEANVSSDLEPEQEQLANELAAILDDSDCSIIDKDHVPESESSSEESRFLFSYT